MRYVQLKVNRKQMMNRARNYRRVKKYWELYKSIGKGDPGFMGGVQALFGMLFPITYPLYLLFSRPYKIQWIKLIYWPFYQVVLMASYPKGMKEEELWVEGTENGLLLGHNKYGHGIWYPRSYPTRSSGISEDPLLAHPKRQLKVRNICEGDCPYDDAFVLQHTISNTDAAEYLHTGAEETSEEVEDSCPSVQFTKAFGFEFLDLSSFKIKDVNEVFYPLWIVKYKRVDTHRLVAFPGVGKWYFDRVDITKPALHNDILCNLFEDL